MSKKDIRKKEEYSSGCEKSTLSACIIAKNEEQNIARCLDSLQRLPVEIVVVDTGSTDATKSIAEKYTEHVYDFVWCDDFAAAKNYAISKASGTHVMVLDSDEYIEAVDMEKLLGLLVQYPDAVGRIRRKNIFERKGQRQETLEWINRIFPKELFRYEGRIHEQVVAFDAHAYETYLTPVVIGHTGYDLSEEERKQKAERNARLLLQELECLKQAEQENPESKKDQAQIPYILYQLGKSCYLAEDYEQACAYFSEGLSFDLDPKLEYVIDMVETYGYALLNSGQAQTAMFFENIYEEFGNCADFKFLMGLIYMNNALFSEAVEEFLKATKYKESRTTGANSYMAFYNIGVIYECLEQYENAREFYIKCKEYEPAKKRLDMLGK